MKRFALVTLCVLMGFLAFGCGKKSGLEGKVVDGKGKPVANVKIIAKQVQPIKGYEQFETTTTSDGTFSFGKLFPTSEYVIFPWYDDWTEAPMRTLRYKANNLIARFTKEGWITEQKMKIQSGPEGETTLLASPIVIQPCISSIEGKVVDGKGQPLANIKIIAKQVKPIPGYEQFEYTTGSDGSFSFGKLFPYSKYLVIPNSGNWNTDVRWTVKTRGEQELEAFKYPLTIRFTVANGVVTDSRTGLQWAAKDNGRDINWQNACSYCQNYRGGGHTDWRLPTFSELKGLYKAGIRYKSGDIINITNWCPWVSETRGSEAGVFWFFDGRFVWNSQPTSDGHRALPVRGGK